MSIAVFQREEAGISIKAIVDLLHLSFQERISQGLCFTCSSIAEEQFSEKVKDGVVFVAMDMTSNELMGTATIQVSKDKRNVTYGYFEYLAITPKAKQSGIATKLFNEVLSYLSLNNAKYVLIDTAVNAMSSVNWHLKNGFIIYEYRSFESTNYWSYVFIKYLDPNSEKSKVFIWCHYLITWITTKIAKDVMGNYTWLGKKLNWMRTR